MKLHAILPGVRSVCPERRTIDSALLEQLFDQVPDVAFFIKDTSGRYLVVNHTMVERHGLRMKSQMLGKKSCEVCPGELGRAPSEQDEHVLRTGQPMMDHLELHWRSPNRPCWCLTTKLPMRDENGNINGLIGLSRDVRAPDPLHDIPEGASKALSWLEKNFANPMSPATLCRRAGMSGPRFARIVKRIFNLTPMQLITKTRLAAAEQMLRRAGRSVADIALDCGYCDHSAFTRAFRSATGMTPTEFRAQQPVP